MKKLIFIFILFTYFISFAQTNLKPTPEKFSNGESVYSVIYHGKNIGEFWPVHGINLVTKKTNPALFQENVDMVILHQKLGGVATAPDGMTSASIGLTEGRCLVQGVECGTNETKDYGVVLVQHGYIITFTHARELRQFDTFYENQKKKGSTLFFLPSIKRTDIHGEIHMLRHNTKIQRLLVQRITPSGQQIGVIVFDDMTTYNQSIQIMDGLDRDYQNGSPKSRTKHIYVLDGGPAYGQCVKEVNGKIKLVGTRKPGFNSNYLVFY